MADRLYSKAFKFMVKFPDGIEPPDGYKPPDEYDDYIGVTSFRRPSRQEDSRADDGFTGNLQCVPILIEVSEAVMSKVMPLLNKPMKPDWEVELIELGKEEKDEPSKVFESKLTGVRFAQAGEYGPQGPDPHGRVRLLGGEGPRLSAGAVVSARIGASRRGDRRE